MVVNFLNNVRNHTVIKLCVSASCAKTQ